MRTLRKTIVRGDPVDPVAGFVDRTVVGTPTEITTVLAAAQATGRLVYASAPRPMPAGDPRVSVAVRVLDRSPTVARAPARPAVIARTPRRRLKRPTVVAMAVTAILPVLIGLGYAIVLLVQTVIALIPAILGVLFILALLWFALGRAGACPGVHCPGCGCR
jgi:hypothetical protein